MECFHLVYSWTVLSNCVSVLIPVLHRAENCSILTLNAGSISSSTSLSKSFNLGLLCFYMNFRTSSFYKILLEVWLRLHSVFRSVCGDLVSSRLFRTTVSIFVRSSQRLLMFGSCLAECSDNTNQVGRQCCSDSLYLSWFSFHLLCQLSRDQNLNFQLWLWSCPFLFLVLSYLPYVFWSSVKSMNI